MNINIASSEMYSEAGTLLPSNIFMVGFVCNISIRPGQLAGEGTLVMTLLSRRLAIIIPLIS